MQSLMNLNYHGNSVRVVMINDNPHWIVADVCKVLGLSKTANVASRIDRKYICSTYLSGTLYNVVSEPGLYELIFRSDKPDAKLFRDWVFETVLPSIRKTGSYTTKSIDIPSYQIEDPVKRALKWVEETRKHQQALSEAQDIIETQQPCVDMVKDLVSNDWLYSMQKAGAMLGYGRNNLFSILRANHIIQNHNTMPYRRFIDAGYFVVKLLKVNELLTNGTQTFVTTKGLKWLHGLVNRHKNELESTINMSQSTNNDTHYYNIDKHNDKRITDKKSHCDDMPVDINDFLDSLLGKDKK